MANNEQEPMQAYLFVLQPYRYEVGYVFRLVQILDFCTQNGQEIRESEDQGFRNVIIAGVRGGNRVLHQKRQDMSLK